MPNSIRTWCLCLVITILSLQHLPQYHSSNSELFKTLSTRCRTVITELSPCADFIRDEATMPEEACCNGVHNVAGSAKGGRAAVAEICECLKQGLDDTTYDPTKVHQLPTQCGANIDFPPVNSNVDCN